MKVAVSFRKLIAAFGPPSAYPPVRDAIARRRKECDQLRDLAQQHLDPEVVAPFEEAEHEFRKKFPS